MKKQTVLFICLTMAIVTHLNAQNLVGLGGGQEFEYENLKWKEPLLSKRYLLADDSIRYPLSQIWYYQIDGNYFKRRLFSNGNYEFLRRESEGTIELYSTVRRTTSYDAVTGVPMSSSAKVNFYSISNKTFQKVNVSNLKRDISDYESCMQELKKAKTLNWVSAIALTAGLGIFIGSAAVDLSKTPDPDESAGIPAGVIIGPALCFTPWILSGAKRKHFENAITIYNERH
jgi:hypothetical protein